MDFYLSGVIIYFKYIKPGPLNQILNHCHLLLTACFCFSEKCWKAVMAKADADASKNDTRSQHLNKHKKSQPQSQG